MYVNYLETYQRIDYPDGSYWMIWTMHAELFNSEGKKIAQLNFPSRKWAEDITEFEPFIYSYTEPICNGKCMSTPMGIVGPYSCQHCGKRIEPLTITYSSAKTTL